MLESGTFKIDGKLRGFDLALRYNHDLPLAMQFWIAYLARDLLQFEAFLRAAAVMLQVPGGARYEFVRNDDDEDEIWQRIHGRGRRILLDVLADCLNRLEASPGILAQVPGGKDHKPKKLSKPWTDFLDGWSSKDFGLLNVVAEILDELIVHPGLAEIDAAPGPAWWQGWWNRIRDAPPDSTY